VGKSSAGAPQIVPTGFLLIVFLFEQGAESILTTITPSKKYLPAYLPRPVFYVPKGILSDPLELLERHLGLHKHPPLDNFAWQAERYRRASLPLPYADKRLFLRKIPPHKLFYVLVRLKVPPSMDITGIYPDLDVKVFNMILPLNPTVLTAQGEISGFLQTKAALQDLLEAVADTPFVELMCVEAW
jgi:hypothetical protein